MDAEEVAQTMREASPKYVPRNWMLMEARGSTHVCAVFIVITMIVQSNMYDCLL